MNRITNSKELKSEIIQYKELAKKNRADLKSNMHILKESFRPANIVSSLVSDFTGIKIDKDNFLKDGIAYTLSLIFQQFILKAERKFEKGTYKILDDVMEKIRHFVSSFSSQEAKRKDRTEKEN